MLWKHNPDPVIRSHWAWHPQRVRPRLRDLATQRFDRSAGVAEIAQHPLLAAAQLPVLFAQPGRALLDVLQDLRRSWS